MARVTTYLNFARNTEEAFLYYKSVFKTDFVTPIMRFGDGPPCPSQAPLPVEDARLVMHVALPILGGHVLMGTDSPESMGFKLKQGNNVYINLEPDTRAETDRLFAALGEGARSKWRCKKCSGAPIGAACPIASAYSGCSTAPRSRR